MIYEFGRFDTKIGAAPLVAAGIASFMKEPESLGALMGAWVTEFGELNQVLTLRAFETYEDFAAERKRAVTSTNPFHSAAHLVQFSLEPYQIFPFLEPPKLGKFGPIYEIRSYELQPNGLNMMLEAWEVAVPARIAVSPLIIAAYSLEGVPRFTHIWAYASLEQRSQLRAEAVKSGIWPPKGGPTHLATMRSTIALPTAFSPLG
ncbi:MAG: NIPSNAP family protein [Candidatus Pacebacteria bacterium]|nr:NIPSNAP family protein [Candidatus Paceibacterota bacterium]